MTTYVWAGSTAHRGGYGHASWTGGTNNKNYLSGVTHGFYWNDPRNWLEEFQGACGGVSGGWTGDAVYYGRAQDVPGAGDVVILKEVLGGDFVNQGPGVGVTGTFPKAPLLFGGYAPSTNTDADFINNYVGGGGWVGVTAAGKTSGKLSLFRVENSYLNSEYNTSECSDGFIGRFPVGVKGNDIRSIEQKTKNKTSTAPRNTWSPTICGGTFSGVQIKAETFIHEGVPDNDFCWNDSGDGSTGGNDNFSINLIHSIIDTTHINGFNSFVASGVTFDQLFIERINLPKSKWDRRGGGLWLQGIPENSIMTGRPHVGCRVIDHAGGSGYLRIGGLTGGFTIIRCDETVPKIDVITNFRRRPFWIDAPTITTLNLYPEGSNGVSVNPTGEYYGEHQPVVLLGLDWSIGQLAQYTTITNCNLEDTNPVYGGSVATSDVWYIEDKDITARGTENRLGINKGVTFDNLNIKGGRVYIGHREDRQDCGSWYPPINYNGGAVWDIGQVRVTDGELHEYVYVNCNHPNRPEWNNFEIGGCVNPCTKAGFKIISNGNVVKWHPGMYIVADTTIKGSTGEISLSRWSQG